MYKKTVRFVDYLSLYLDLGNIDKEEFAKNINKSKEEFDSILNNVVKLSNKDKRLISKISGISLLSIKVIEDNADFEDSINDYLITENLTYNDYLKLLNFEYYVDNNIIKFLDISSGLQNIKDIFKFLV